MYFPELNSTDIGLFIGDSLTVLTDSKIFLHLLLAWIVSLLFCLKIFPLFFSTKSLNKSQDAKRDVKDYSENKSRNLMPPPPGLSSSRSCVQNVNSPEVPSKLNESRIRSDNKKFTSQLELEVCGKAKEAGKHPSYVGLVLTLVHNYNIDINKPVLGGGYSVFHCALLSTSLELVTSLSPMADLDIVTSQGDSPLYLAVYAAAHRLRSLPASCQEGLEIVQHLLEAGCDVNTANKAGWSALHQASRLGHERMIRLLLDWGAEMRSSGAQSHNNTLPSSRKHDISLLSSCSSVVTRSMSKRKERSTSNGKMLLS